MHNMNDILDVINKMFSNNIVILPIAKQLLFAIEVVESIKQVPLEEARYEMNCLLKDLSITHDVALSQEELDILKIILKEVAERPFNYEGLITGEG